MEKNKNGKYFKYAIGEIILVVVGILIALQINNWNENRKDKLSELKYLKGIVSNLNDDISELNNHSRIDTVMYKAQTSLIKNLSSDNLDFDNNKFKENFLIGAYGVNWF